MRTFTLLLCPILLSAQTPAQQTQTQAIRVDNGKATINGQPVPDQPLDPKDLCTVEGRVIDAATGVPIRNAFVSMRPTVATNLANGPQPAGTATDAEGKFVLREVIPGTYRLTADRNGYLANQYGSRRPGATGAPITLSRAQAMTSVVFKMFRQAVITGHVSDELGDPMERAQVALLKYQYVNRERQLVNANSGATDDQGNFRMFGLVPGKYYLKVTGPQDMMVMSGPGDTNAAQFAFLPVYYPGGTEESMAAAIDVEAGGQLQGYNFTLRKTRAFRISGVIPNRPTPNSTVMTMLRKRANSGLNASPGRFSQVDSSGKFDIRGLGPGSYSLQAATGDQGKAWTGTLDFDIADRDLTDQVLTLSPGVELAGEVVVEDNTPTPVKLENLRVNILGPTSNSLMMGGSSGQNRFTFGTTANAQVGEDGKFVLKDIFADAQRPSINGMPTGFYVKSVQLGDKDVYESGIDFSHGVAGNLKITISGKAGSAQGSVVDDTGNPITGATVLLVPKSDKRRAAGIFYKNSVTNNQGQFTFMNIDPGEYRAYAWEDVENGIWMDADFMKAVESKGTDVTIDPGGSASVQLTRIAAK